MAIEANARVAELFRRLDECPVHGVKLVVESEKVVPLKRRKGLYDKIIIKKCPICDYRVKIVMLISGSGEKDEED